jgi:hypothetical protein
MHDEQACLEEGLLVGQEYTEEAPPRRADKPVAFALELLPTRHCHRLRGLLESFPTAELHHHCMGALLTRRWTQ